MGEAAQGRLSMGLNLSATAVRVVHPSHCPDIGIICTVRNEPGQLHDQRFTIAEARLVGDYGFDERWGAELQLPLRLNHTTVQYKTLDGAPYYPDYTPIHHRNETLFGVGDPWLQGRLSWELGPLRGAARLGITVPLGSVEEDPFERGRQGLVHQHIQFGTGTWNQLLGLEASGDAGRFRIGGYGQAQLTFYQNRHGYRSGNRFAFGVSVGTAVWGELRLAAGADLLNERPEKWGGRVQQDGNLGRTDLLLGGSISHPFAGIHLAIEVKAPVYQRIISSGHDGGQLSYPAIVTLSLQRAFDLMARSAEPD
jgi:hypothetical protein